MGAVTADLIWRPASVMGFTCQDDMGGVEEAGMGHSLRLRG